MNNDEKNVLNRRKAGGGASNPRKHSKTRAAFLELREAASGAYDKIPDVNAYADRVRAGNFPLLGMFADGKNLVDEFIANKRFEKELEERKRPLIK